MTKLIDPKDFVQSNPTLQYFGGEFFVRFLMRILSFHRLNDLYEKIHELQGLAFIEVLISQLKIKLIYNENELKRIPATGPVIVASNHPLGGLDALMLIYLISFVRKDIKVVSNPLFTKISNIEPFFIDIKDLEKNSTNKSSAQKHLEENGILCIFPTGNTSSFEAASKLIYDKAWNIDIVDFIKKVEVPVVPFFFQVKRKRMIKINMDIPDPIKNASLPIELFHLKNKSVTARIGKPMPVADQQKFEQTDTFSRFLRAKTYGLENNQKIRFYFFKNLLPKAKPEKIVEPVQPKLIQKEILGLKKNYLLFNIKEYQVFCAPSTVMPNIIREIGRLREITFREVGEGSNHSIDLDEYDLYYHQMFIWDEENQSLVGAYRLGLGQEIMFRYGRSGFYLNSLFQLNEALDPVLTQSVELGRSFVVKDYQRKPMPLFLLWKGILYFLLKNNQYRYLIGPVSISNNYSSVSKELIIKTITNHYLCDELAKHIKPKKTFRFQSSEENINALTEDSGHDLNKLDNLVGELDQINSGIPVLLKKYLKLNARIAGFNVDPKFNNCLDGLIVLDIFNVPVNIIESLGKEVNDGSLLDRFYSSRE